MKGGLWDFAGGWDGRRGRGRRVGFGRGIGPGGFAGRGFGQYGAQRKGFALGRGLPPAGDAEVDLLPIGSRRLILDDDRREKAGVDELEPEIADLGKIAKGAAQRDFAAPVQAQAGDACAGRSGLGDDISGVQVRGLVQLQKAQEVEFAINGCEMRGARFQGGHPAGQARLEEQGFHIGKREHPEQECGRDHRLALGKSADHPVR